MMSTVTAATSAKAKRGSGPNIAQAAKASKRNSDDQRHEPRRHLIGQPLDRRARALRRSHHLHDLREQRVAPDLVGAHDEAAALIERAGNDFASAVLVTGMDSPVTIDSSTDERPSRTTAVDRDLLARPHPQAVADQDDVKRDFRLAAVGAIRRAVFGARSSSARIAPEVRSRARSSSTWPSSTSTVIPAAASK